MVVTVAWLAGETELATSDYEDFVEATKHAKSQFPIKMSRLGVTAVEIRDEMGKCLLRHPTPEDPAPEPRKPMGLKFRR